MIFAKVDTELRDHRRAHEAGAAMATWAWALLWTRAQQRKGFVAAIALRGSWVGERKARADMRKLVKAGMATPVEGGWKLRLLSLPRPRALGALRARVIARGLVCGICGGAVPVGDVHIDHIQALANGGPHEESNLQVAHSLCNKRKGAR
jgi:5-methylcytosine-specific restriction endonuclease McrA